MSSLAILNPQVGYDWPDEVVDIGLTIADHDVPILGVLTHRHMALPKAFNYQFRGMLHCKLRWSTTSIGCRNDDIQSVHWTKRGISAIMNMGNYTRGQLYSPGGTFQTTSGDTDITYAIDRPCNSKKHQGQRWTIEFINGVTPGVFERKTLAFFAAWASTQMVRTCLTGLRFHRPGPAALARSPSSRTSTSTSS